MSREFYRYPPRPSSGAGTFSDNIVGFQIVDGGGLTQGNFEFTTSVVEKVNRSFTVGSFSEPISLDTLNISSVLNSKALIAKDFRVYPNFDLSQVTQFTLYGSLSKRLSSSITKIINFFPGAIEVSSLYSDATSGNTANNISYDSLDDVTNLEIEVEIMKNPFGIDFSVNSTRNLSLLDHQVTPLRNLAVEYSKYSLFVDDIEYPLVFLMPTDSLYTGNLEITVKGNPFSGASGTTSYLILRPNNYYSDKGLIEPFDEVEKFLLNRLITPQYTAVFQIPMQTEDGVNYVDYENVTWPLDGRWNLDIATVAFDFYINTISSIADSYDSFKTNLITRFLTTQAFKDFDTDDQKVQKVLNIYGRSFDEVKKFIDALAYMNSVNYNVKNDIPSQLLKNLAETIGWGINISPITNETFLESVFGNNAPTQYGGYTRSSTPTELNYQFYRNIILNSAYLFKSKGTRKSIEFMLRLVGAPEALVEFNENIYTAGQRINMGEFNRNYLRITGGTYTQLLPTYDSGTTFSIFGVKYTGFTSQKLIQSADIGRSDFPVDSDGYPRAVAPSEDYFFQQGAGWYELNKQHQSLQQVNKTTSIFTGQNFNIQTYFEPFTYGQKYLERYRHFPYLNMGYNLNRVIDNKKSWVYNDTGLRIGNSDGNFNAYYNIDDEKLVINVKNIDLFLNPAQGLVYDVWYMSNQYNYPIPSTGLTSPYPEPGGVDWTVINPQPNKKSFFEFAQTFWVNMINVRNRQFISDGKTGGYPTLQSIWWKYINSQSAINIPNDNYTYQTMTNYINGLGTYWVKLIEQMIPATTLWMGGTKYENSIFHRQKFVYRLQRGCQILPVPCDPCSVVGNIFPYTCVDETLTCGLYPWTNPNITTTVTSFRDMLYQAITVYLSVLDVKLSDCALQSITSSWYVNVKIDGNNIVNQLFYTGYGINDAPSNTQWLDAINTYVTDELLNEGLGFVISDETFTVTNLGCDPDFKDKEFQLNTGISFSISCK